MPIYQYDCARCQKQVEVFFRSISKVDDAAAKCPECGGKKLTRVVSRIARGRSTREAIDSIDLQQELGRLEGNDPGSFSKWAKRMGDQYDGELGTDFGELASKADAGLDPSERADPSFAIGSRLSRAKERLTGTDE